MKYHYWLIIFILFIFSSDSIAQTIRFKGLVLSKEELNPIPFASIAYKLTGIGVLANENALFQFECKAGDTLLISAIGYQNIEWVLNPKDSNIIQRIYLQSLIYKLHTAEIRGIKSPEQLRKAILNMKMIEEPKPLQGVKQYKGSLEPGAATMMSPISLIYNSKLAKKSRVKKWGTQISMPKMN